MLRALLASRRHAPALRRLLAVLAACALATGCASLAEKERELTFRVVKGDASWYAGTPAGLTDVWLPVGGGAPAQRIHAWWWPAADPRAPAILYLHGVRWNLTGNLRRIEQLRQFGFSVFAIDYRGFGKSDGELPSEEMSYEDARAAWAWLAQRQPDPARRYIYGHSLGGAVAIDLAARLAREGPGAPRARGLVVEATFTSFAEVAAEVSWSWLPTSVIVSQKFDSIDKIRDVDVPVLFVHGADDRYVPARFAQALYDAAREPKRLLVVEGGSHNNSMWVGRTEYRHALAELFGIGAGGRGGPQAGATPAPAHAAAY